MENLFNISSDLFVENKKVSQGSNLKFKPDPKLGKDGVYKAMIRFIPWYKNVKKSIYKKYYIWVENPATGENFGIDCPTTIGEKSVLYELYWKLKNSKYASDQEMVSLIQRKQKFFSLIQVIKDSNNPENEGKIMVWDYGIKIYNKLMAEMEPEDEMIQTHVPFDLQSGKIFLVNTSIVGGYTNYDSCKFLNEPAGLIIDNKKIFPNSQNDYLMITEFLKNNSPDLENIAFRRLTEIDEEKIKEIVDYIYDNAKGLGKKQNYSNEYEKPNYSQKNKNNVKEDFEYVPKNHKEVDPKEILAFEKEGAVASQSNKNGFSDDDILNEILNELN
jgi:hypothetical protein